MILINTLRDFFSKNDWDTQEVGSPISFSMRFHGQNGEWPCVAQVIEEQARIIFFSVFPQDIPQEKRKVISEFITLCNYGLQTGNFELNFTNGDLRFRTSLEACDGAPGEARLKQLLHVNLAMMDTYLPGFQMILRDEAKPLEILSKLTS